MKKKIIMTTIIVLVVIILLSIINKTIWEYKVAHAVKIVELNTSEVPVYEEKVKLKQLIKKINGKLDTNPTIDTNKVGKQTIEFKYTTDEGYPVKYEVEIEVVDRIKPLIYQGKKKTVYTDYDGVLSEDLFCGDNYDQNPKCNIEGDYDTKTPGTYDLKFVCKDSSNNKSENSFTLTVKEKVKSKTSSSPYKNTNPTNTISFDSIKEKYQGEGYQYGIDVSHWEGDIDYKKLKKAGVDFAYIRVGRGDGIGKPFIEDEYFVQNIKGFNNVGIPVGVYFYSYANNVKDVKKEVDWIVKKIKDYDVDLELAFDWEEWDYFQEYDLSFHDMQEMAKEFKKEANKKGYKAILYSSKNFMEEVWGDLNVPVWLAHYTEQTNYQGDYRVWQLTDAGTVDGIDGTVDLNIRYPNKNKG